MAGIVLCQAVLYWPSLVGQKVLLPLDLLGSPRFYWPILRGEEIEVTSSSVLSDLILDWEFGRRLAVSELRAGRIPLWNPYSYCGSPSARWETFCPFNVIYYVWPSPVTLAWIQVVKSIVAGMGAYVFFRRCLGVGYWPAAHGAWCYPLTGYFVLWQGYPLSHVIAWFGWVLLATDFAIRRPAGWGGPGLALFTGCAVVSRGEVAAQVLLASGMYAVWCVVDEYRGRLTSSAAVRGIVTCGGGWALGLLLSTPYLLPMVEYSATGSRLSERAAGLEDRPPVGWEAVPQVVIPEIYGANRWDSLRIVKGPPPESSATAYAGLLATLLVAPLGWCSSRHRSFNALWAVLGFAAIAWTLNVPGIVSLLRLPGINLFSHNRFVFVTAFSILATAVAGLDYLSRARSQDAPPRREWICTWLGLAVTLAAWCMYRAIELPEQVISATEPGFAGPLQKDVGGLVCWNFTRTYLVAAGLCLLTVCGWMGVWMVETFWNLLRRFAGLLLVGELLWSAYGINPQADRALYFPDVRALSWLSAAPDGRALGVDCLPARILEAYGLRDLRGYDGVDPARLVDLMDLARAPDFPANPFGKLQWYRPALSFGSEGEVRVSPILSMLNLRYLIWRGTLPAGARSILTSGVYDVLENPRCLPRVFVPRRVEAVPDHVRRLQLIAQDSFDARDVAYLEDNVRLPADCCGAARIESETPREVTVSVDMQTEGLVVLADLWDRGWNAFLDGASVPILRTNHALRGVVVPAGASKLVFRYEPRNFVWGVRLFGASVSFLMVWGAAIVWRRRTRLL
jgi:hypothetical protein